MFTYKKKTQTNWFILEFDQLCSIDCILIKKLEGSYDFCMCISI